MNALTALAYAVVHPLRTIALVALGLLIVTAVVTAAIEGGRYAATAIRDRRAARRYARRIDRRQPDVAGLELLRAALATSAEED